jgi:HEAT repeats
MKTTPVFRGGGVLILLATLPSVTLLHAAKMAPASYRATLGQSNVYSVQIEIRGENGTDMLAGNIISSMKAGPSNIINVNLRGSLMPKRDASRPPAMGGGFYAPRWMSPVSLGEACELQIDDHGRLLRVAGDYPLPVPLGSVAQMLVEALPTSTDSRWESTDQMTVLDDPLTLGPAHSFLNPQPYGMPYYGGGFNPRTTIATLVGTRIAKYETKASEAPRVLLKKSSTFKTLLKSGSEPRISSSSESEIIFDRELGILRSVKTEFKVVVNTETVTRRTSGSVQVKLLEGKERDTALEQPSNAFGGPPRKLTPADLQKIITELKSDDINLQRQAASRLQNAELPEAPPELIDLLTGHLADSDLILRVAASRVIADYGTKEQVPALLKLLKDGERSDRSAVIRGLGRLKDLRAAEPLANLVARGQDNYQAVEALGKLGPAAEDAVLPLLKEKSIETLRSACNILKQIGTSESVAPLRELMLDPDQSVSSAASEAIRAIQSRE